MAVALNRNAKANHSPLYAKLLAANGEMVNACPYGCATETLSERGYCDHLLGFTVPVQRDGEKPEFYEPLVEKIAGDGRFLAYFVDGFGKKKIPAGSHLEWITASARVYHKNGRKAKGE